MASGESLVFLEKDFYFKLYMCVCVSVSLYTCECRCPQRPEVSIRSPGTGVRGGCELPYVGFGT